MTFSPFEIVRATWIVLALYWIFSSFRVKKMRRREPVFRRFAYLTVIALAALLLFPRQIDGLSLRFSHSLELRWIGAVITAAGAVLAIWARRHIGTNWSGMVALREGHQLVRSGPYARIRHPIYSGLLLALLGTALTAETYGALAVLAIVSAGISFKAKREEKLLAGEFGAEFEEHRRHTGFLFPRLF
jgi:protein-S-isoprenylcysteine O-methyltransferase Ste14